MNMSSPEIATAAAEVRPETSDALAVVPSKLYWPIEVAPNVPCVTKICASEIRGAAMSAQTSRQPIAGFMFRSPCSEEVSHPSNLHPAAAWCKQTEFLAIL